VLGSIFAILSAASFALNNATVRRGVVSGTPIQAMAVSVPLGVVCFLPLVFLTGELSRLPQFPETAFGRVSWTWCTWREQASGLAACRRWRC